MMQEEFRRALVEFETTMRAKAAVQALAVATCMSWINSREPTFLDQIEGQLLEAVSHGALSEGSGGAAYRDEMQSLIDAARSIVTRP